MCNIYMYICVIYISTYMHCICTCESVYKIILLDVCVYMCRYICIFQIPIYIYVSICTQNVHKQASVLINAYIFIYTYIFIGKYT